MRTVLLSSLLLLFSCADSGELSEKDLIAFILDKENGLTVTKEDAGYTVSTTFRPSDFIARQQMVSESSDEYDSLRKLYSHYIYFMIEISKEGKDLETVFAMQQQDFASRISFLSSGFSEKVKLQQSRKLMIPVDYIYIRSYGSSTSRFLIAFEKVEEDMDIVIDGYELGFNRISFPFQYAQIRNTPQLKR